MFHDNGTNFTGCQFQILLETYGIDTKPTSAKSRRTNKISEKIQSTMGEILRTANFTGLHCQEEIITILQAVSWDMRITSHTPYLHLLVK